MPYVTHDIGGFNGTPSDDLYARWVQFGTFQPILRLHSNHAPRLPWEFGAAAEASAEKFLRLREALVPYTYTLARQAADTGLPITRALYLNYPENSEAYTYKNEYLYGDNVLVAPVSTAGTGTVTTNVWFPPGTWTDYFTGINYTGPTTVTVATTLDTMPVFLKSGGIMPTRTNYVDNTVQNPLNQVTLDIAAGADGTFSLYEDAGEGNAYKSGQSATTATSYTDTTHTLTICARQGTFTGAVATRTWTAKFRGVANPPAQVTVNGAAVTGYTYDATTHAPTVPTPAASATATTTIAYTPGTSTAPPTGPITGVGSSRCVDIPNVNPADGTQLQLYDCNGTVAQAWTMAANGTVQAMGKCMDIAGANTADGTAVQIYSCNGTAAQQWTYDPATSELHAFGKCLDAYGGGTASGTKLILYTCHGGSIVTALKPLFRFAAVYRRAFADLQAAIRLRTRPNSATASIGSTSVRVNLVDGEQHVTHHRPESSRPSPGAATYARGAGCSQRMSDLFDPTSGGRHADHPFHRDDDRNAGTVPGRPDGFRSGPPGTLRQQCRQVPEGT